MEMEDRMARTKMSIWVLRRWRWHLEWAKALLCRSLDPNHLVSCMQEWFSRSLVHFYMLLEVCRVTLYRMAVLTKSLNELFKSMPEEPWIVFFRCWSLTSWKRCWRHVTDSSFPLSWNCSGSSVFNLKISIADGDRPCGGPPIISWAHVQLHRQKQMTSIFHKKNFFNSRGILPFGEWCQKAGWMSRMHTWSNKRCDAANKVCDKKGEKLIKLV